MSDTERLIVKMEARVNQFEKAMQRAEKRGTRTYQGLSRGSRSATRQMEADMLRSTSSINRALAVTSSKIGSFGKAFAGGLVGGAVAAGIAGISSNIAGTVENMASLGDEAERAGLGLESFQEWKFVAEQNRIGVDQLVDGFKELNLRADEFITNGAGPAAESFRRIGLSAAKLKTALQDPSELMLTIMERMRGLDRAGQIRVADEIFGGSAGERFVELLDQGRAGIEATIDRAREVGAVMDQDMVAKAAELDRRLHEIQETVGNLFKRIAVGAADAAVELTDLRTKIDDLFTSEEQGRSILGDDLYDGLSESQAVLDQTEGDIAKLNAAYQVLAETSRAASLQMASSASLMASWGYDEASNDLAEAATEMHRLAEEFSAGTISGDEFAAKLDEVRAQGESAFNALDDVDRVSFSGAISEVGRLGDVLAGAISLANSLKQAISGAAGAAASAADTAAMRARHEAEQASMEVMREQAAAKEAFLASEDAQNAKTAERLQLEREIDSLKRRASESGVYLTNADAESQAAENVAAALRRSKGGKSGGSKKSSTRKASGRTTERQSDFDREIESTRERIAQWEAEATALIAVAQGGQEYGDAIEYARKKAELLYAAQKDGKKITPELEAQIDALAQSYVTAGQSAEDAAEKMRQIEEAGQNGRDALISLFDSVLSGSKSAKDAVIELLAEIARVQAIKAILNIPGMGGVAQGLGDLLTFASGGYTGAGGRYEPAGVVHRGEYVMSAPAVNRIGVQNLEAMHGRALKGYASGGYVGVASGGSTGSTGGTSKIEIKLSDGVEASILQRAQGQALEVAKGVTRQGLQEYDRGTNQRVQSAIRENQIRGRM